MFTVYRFVETVLTKLFNTKKITEDLVIFLTPHLTACSNFFCKRGKLLSAKHNEQFVILIRWKLIKPIIKINGKTQRYLQSIRHQQWGKKWQIWNTIPLLVDLVCEVRKKQRGKKWLIHLTILVESLCNFWFQSEGEIFGTVEKQSIQYFYREYWQSSY